MKKYEIRRTEEDKRILRIDLLSNIATSVVFLGLGLLAAFFPQQVVDMLYLLTERLL